MKIYKKLFFLLIISALFLGQNVLAARKSSQFPKEPAQPLPADAGIYPSSKNAIEQNKIGSEIEITTTEESNDQNKQKSNLRGQTNAESEGAADKNNPAPFLNLWVLFFALLIVIFVSLAVVFFLLQKKMVL